MRKKGLLCSFLLVLSVGVCTGQTVRTTHHVSIEVGNDIAATSVSQDGRYILSGSQDGWVKGWSLESNEPMLVNHLEGRILFLSYLSGDNAFVAVAESGTITKYMWPEGTTAAQLETRHSPRYATLSGGRRFLAVMTESGTVELLDLQSEQRMATIEIEKDLDEVVFAGFDRTGRQLLAISNRGRALSWNPSTGQLLRDMKLGGKSLSGSESKMKIAASRRSSNKFITGIEEVALPKGGVTGRRARPGQLVRRDWLVGYNLKTGSQVGRFQYPGGAVQALAHGPGDNHAVVVGGTAKDQADIINLRKEKIVRKVTVDSDISSVSVSENGKWLALSTDGSVLVKKMNTPSTRTEVAGNLPALEPDRAVNESQSPDAEQPATPEERTSKQPGETTAEDAPPPPMLDRQVPTTAAKRPNDVAVVLGIEEYKNPDVPNVDYAVRDARVMKKYLTRTLGFREENIIYVENADAATMTRIFGTADDPRGQLYDWVKPGESSVFVYYSGHGAPNPETENAYFVPSNTNPNYLSQNGYPVNQLYENLGALPTESITVVLEACFSGVSESGAVVQDISPAVLSVENPVMAMEDGLAFTAGAADQVSTWYDEKQHGLFTYYFLKGLRGNADANEDEAVTAQEMEAYLGEKVPYRAQRMHSRKQTPQVVGSDKERVLVQYTTPSEK
jgi:WD40 repeat protein